jgi:Zn-dependent M28 family amino/carboxypeptidase
MRRSILALLAVPAALSVSTPAMAAKDAFNSQGLRNAVTLDGVRDHQQALQLIANANGGTRASGTPGYTASADYVAGKLEDAGYTVTRQPFSFLFTLDQSTLTQIAPTARTYARGTEFKILTDSPNGTATGSVQRVGAGDATPGCESTDFAGFVAGRIALIQRGGCTFRIKTDNAVAAGAAGVIIYDNIVEPLSAINPVLGGPGVTKPAVFTTLAIGQELATAAAAGTLQMSITTNFISEQRMTENLIADTASGDPDRTVVVGAHLDSVPAGPGINDNGSGTAGILEIAEQYAARGLEPRNRIRFAWFGAEERGLLGSQFYVNSLFTAGTLDEVMLNLNFDMIGSPNYARFVYDGDNSGFPVGPGAAAGPDGSGLIEAVFVNYFTNQGLPSEPTPFSGRSDYGPFIARNIPAGGLFTGAEGIKTPLQAQRYGGTAGQPYDPCYHQACDTFANNNDFALDTMADGAAHAVYTFGRTKVEIVNGAVLKPGRPTPDGDNDGDGTLSGGGLHAEHDHEDLIAE